MHDRSHLTRFHCITSLTRTREKSPESREETPAETIIDQPGSTGTRYTKLILTGVAGIISTGLFMDNVAVIIGAMLRSPFLGLIYAFTSIWQWERREVHSNPWEH